MSSGIRHVSFSLIGEMRRADLVLETANGLPEVAFHFYGRVDSGFKQRFGAGQFGLPNVEYHGVFDSVPGDVRAELSRYDLPLLPASSPNEGVPEVLVETKIAAVPPLLRAIAATTPRSSRTKSTELFLRSALHET